MLLLNLLLALAWVALTGQLTPVNFGFGFVVGFLLLWLLRHAYGGHAYGELSYFRKVWQIIKFIGFFIWQLLLANLRVAYEVVTPPHTMRPAIVAVPLDVKHPAAVTLLANLITLTPGTLTLDVAPNGKTLYVHAMHVQDADTFRREIKEGFECYIKEIFE
jgi:multicomponent Na+:H+ antiporter subunit E